MTPTRHLMIRTQGNGRESLFECAVEGCGRQLVLNHADVRVTVIDPGQSGALHEGYAGPVALTASQPEGC